MKKRHSIHVILAAAALLLVTAACTKDELADGDRLPEGQYPVEIARITLGVEGGEAQPWGAPQTRAWYPAKSGTIDLGNQSQSLAYLLYATGTGDYQTPVTLTFAHQLAKVRVTPTGDALGEVQSLQLYTYTQCTYEKGEVVQGSQEGWIEMKPCEYTENSNAINCWEANVVPGKEITKLRANGTEERTLSAAINPVAGSFYNITLNNNKGYVDDGSGNYTVTTADGLKAVADIANNGNRDINITLDKDIDLTGTTWTPIGTTYNNSYTGTFDGGGKTITGLTVTGSNEFAGLFGYIGSGGTVKNVVLKDVQIESDNQYGYVGGVAGNSDGNIENCSVQLLGHSEGNGRSRRRSW